VRSPPAGLKDSTVCPAFFIAPAINPRTVCFCQPMVRTICDSVAPFLRRSIAMTSAFLPPRPALLTSGAWAAGLARSAFLTKVARRECSSGACEGAGKGASRPYESNPKRQNGSALVYVVVRAFTTVPILWMQVRTRNRV